MSEKRFELDVRMDMPKLLIDTATNERYNLLLINDIEEIVDLLNELSDENNILNKNEDDLKECTIENIKLKAKVKRLQDIATRTEEEKEHYADLYNECRRFKLSDEAIKQAYADLNRREREKHSQGNATYTAKMNQNEMIY